MDMNTIQRCCLIAMVGAGLAGCGGGSGSGSSGAGAYSVSLDHTSVQFATDRGTFPPSQSVGVTYQGDGLIVGYPVGVPAAPWLDATVTGNATSATVELFVTNTGLPPATYTTTLRFVTGKSDGSVVKYVDLPVSLELRDTFTVAASDSTLSRSWGSTTNLQATPVLVQTYAKPWHASSDSAWVTLGATQGTGNATITVTVPASASLPVGTHDATVTVTSDDGLSTTHANVHLTVDAPTASVTGALAYALIDTQVTGEQPAHVAFDTGVHGGTWTATPSDSWVKLATTTGTPGVDDVLVRVDSSGADLGPGHHVATIDVAVDLPGASQGRIITVTADVAPRVQFVGDDGAALVSRPDGSTLSKTFLLRDNTGTVDPGWTATTDQAWLSATRLDATHLTITADPTGLGTGFRTAQVVLGSSNAAISNVETITVGLTVDDVAVVDGAVDGFTGPAANIVPDAIRPRFYAWKYGASAIDVRDVYTGALVRTLTPPAGTVQAVGVSADGARLYVEDGTWLKVHVYDLVAGAWQPDLTIPVSRSGSDVQLTSVRLEGHELLVLGDCFLDAATGALRGGIYSASPTTCGPSGRYVIASDADAVIYPGFSRYQLQRDATTGTVRATYAAGGNGGYNARDVASTSDGGVVVPAGVGCGSYDWCIFEYASGSYQQAGIFPGEAYPNNSEAGRFGEWYLGLTSGTVSGYHVVVYGAGRTLLGGYSTSALKDLQDDGVRVSSDGQRVIMATNGYYDTERQLFLFPSIH
jgi:hypothetical protein